MAEEKHHGCYVLFFYNKDRKEKESTGFDDKDELIEFLCEYFHFSEIISVYYIDEYGKVTKCRIVFDNDNLWDVLRGDEE